MATPVHNAVARTGNALIDGLVQGSAWQFSGAARTITYSYSLNDTTVFAWPAMRMVVPSALQAWANVANITFQESGSDTVFTRSTADIAITPTGDELGGGVGAAALGIFPDPAFADAFLTDAGYTRESYPRAEGDIFFDNLHPGFSQYWTGALGFYLVLHEIGHALGLKHPDDDGGAGRPTFAQLGIEPLDTLAYTVMSGGMPGAIAPSTPMPLDILAIQHIYGANMTFATGNDDHHVFGWRTIWDAGGTDRLNGGGAAGPMTLDLRPGHFSTGNGSNVAIAYNVAIENVVGSAYGDTIYGNALANNIDGGTSADYMQGGGGDDSYSVDSRDDAIVEFAGEGVDTVTSRANFTLSPNLENLTLVTGASIDGTGNAGNNVLLGNSGANYLNGAGGDDYIDGGRGLDVMVGGPGDDTFVVAQGDMRGARTVMSMNGQPGTYVLDSERVLLPSDGTFELVAADNNLDRNIDWLSVRFLGSEPGVFWYLDLGAPVNQNLRATTYTGTTRSNSSTPRLDIHGEGRGSEGTGAFTIGAFDYAWVNGAFYIERLQVSFDLRFGSTGGAIAGFFNYNYGMGAGAPEAVIERPGEGRDTVRSSIDYAMADNVEVLQLLGAAAVVGTGNAQDNLITASAIANVLDGGGGNDRIEAGRGADALTGGGGHDFLDGGPGRDTAVFAGPRSAYAVRHDGNRVLVSGPEGTDTLLGIERLRFSDVLVPTGTAPFLDLNGDGRADLIMRRPDGTLDLRTIQNGAVGSQASWGYATSWNVVDTRGDFNGDGRSDLLLRNDSGRLELRQMNGTMSSSELVWNYPSSWKVVTGHADFNGDGRSDVLLRNDSGALEIRLMQGLRYTAETYWPYPSAWKVASAHADFNGDGKSDLLLRHDNGTLEIRLMDGVGYSAEVDWRYPASWKVASADGDFNGDGKSDLLLRNDNGLLEIRLMDGVRYTGEVDWFYPGWQVVSARADFNGDGKSDLLLRHATGALEIRTMNGTVHTGEVNWHYPLAWRVVSAESDFNGDGNSDLLLRHDNGTLEIRLMEGARLMAEGSIALPSGWDVVDATRDFNGDGNSDILLRASIFTKAYHMNGTSVMSAIDLVLPADQTVVG